MSVNSAGRLELIAGVIGLSPEGSHSLRALVRKLAMWALVTGWLGQYCSGFVLQPVVMPAVARALMLFAWVLLGSTSVKPAGSAAGSLKALVRKLAIWARVTGWLGQ